MVSVLPYARQITNWISRVLHPLTNGRDGSVPFYVSFSTPLQQSLWVMTKMRTNRKQAAPATIITKMNTCAAAEATATESNNC